MSFEVLAITADSESVVATHRDQNAAFDDCESRWHGRRTGGQIYVVRDTRTGQRWSYADVLEQRASRGGA